MMHRTWKEVVVCRWRMIGLLAALSICALVGQAGWANADMSLETRVACQRALEEVYWKHTIWPEENTSPKPQLSEVMSEEELRKKVTETLRMSKALEVIWKQPVTGYQLQSELERMAETTRNPEMLQELWSALGNDPQLIAECLSRPLLVERLIHDWYAFDERYHGRLKKRVMRKVGLHDRIEDMKGMGGAYHEMEWKKGRNSGEKAKDTTGGDVLELTEDEWQEETGQLAGIFGVNEEEIPLRRVSALQEDEERFYVMGVLRKGSDRLKVAVVEWKKVGFDQWWARVGERFAPEVEGEEFTYRLPEIAAGSPLPYAPNIWSATAVNPPPVARVSHTAVWTGTEMIVWGGSNGTSRINTGGRYTPSTNTWTPTNTTGAPAAGDWRTAVWTVTPTMVGRRRGGTGVSNTGGRRIPSTKQ